MTDFNSPNLPPEQRTLLEDISNMQGDLREGLHALRVQFAEINPDDPQLPEARRMLRHAERIARVFGADDEPLDTSAAPYKQIIDLLEHCIRDKHGVPLDPFKEPSSIEATSIEGFTDRDILLAIDDLINEGIVIYPNDQDGRLDEDMIGLRALVDQKRAAYSVPPD
jgi:hypothetical protein